MYINKIDELIDKIIDDFYNRIMIRKDILKYLDEINFVKYQLEINKILSDYITHLDKKDINNILQDETNTLKLIEVIKRYIAYYIFLTFAFFYKGKIETFINNIVEFTKNQPNFNFKIDSFFNSESNSIVIKLYTLIKNTLVILDSNNVKILQLIKKPDYNEANNFLKEVGSEIIDTSFRIKSVNNNVHEQAHNIIKTIIILEIYLKSDKQAVYHFLEKSEIKEGEFIYIDIVLPKIEFIDFNTIELTLSQHDVESGLASEIYDIITKYEESELTKEITHDEKILELFNNKIFIPITEDFLLYHKDTEKYEKALSTTNPATQTKKKDETKIKYIINKIDNVTEYFSKAAKEKEEIRKNIEKLFYTPLSERRAILINIIENIKIINKLQNQGKKAIENNEYYHDLLTYRKYPYINFKDFQQYGFSIMTTQTIDTIRSINFEKVNINNRNKNIQFRISSNEAFINIVGLIIPPKYNDIKCFKIKDFIDIRKVGYKKGEKAEKNSNGFITVLKVLNKVLFDASDKERPPIFWLFDLEKDKFQIEKYSVTTKMDTNEQIKIMMSKLYDNTVLLISDGIYKIINKRKNITLQNFEKIIKNIVSIMPIPMNTDVYYNLQKTIFSEKLIKFQDRYDINEDAFPGLVGEIIKLPSFKKEKNLTIPIIKLEREIKPKQIKESELADVEKHGAICQHNISWDNLMAIRKKNPNKFSELIFEFFQQYITKSYEEEYICKSCGTLINLKQYVLDGSYDSDGRFISFNIQMTVDLKDIPEYGKYISSIKNLEGIVSRIASITNINTLTGTSVIIRDRIKRIVKDAIDLLLIHNMNLKSIYKERKEKITSMYGFNGEQSNFFVFELDNSIFVFSSKDKDMFKPIKRNNIILYLLFLIILELGDTQLYYLTGDKTCNYYIFEKIGMNWFKDIKIRKNNENVIVSILNYKVLCYIIFYMSCLLTRYNLWQYESEGTKFDPNIQKTIVYTMVDFINSIIEFYTNKKHHYIYDIIANKFFQKLNTTFSNDSIVDKIKKIEERKISTVDKKTKITTVKIKSIPLQNEYSHGDYFGISEWMSCKVSKSFIPRRMDEFKKYYEISNITNDESGPFHKFYHINDKDELITNVVDKKLKCETCNKTIPELSDDKKLAEKIKENYETILEQKVAEKYCKSGEFHNYLYDTETKCNICAKCKLKDVTTLSKKELDEINGNINKMKKEKELALKNELTKLQNKEKKIEEKHKKIIEEIKTKYQDKFVDDFITKIETLIGKDTNINAADIYLKYDAYIIDHNHHGEEIKPFTIKDDGDKISFKQNHPFFKQDVIYYTNYKLQIDIFYNAETKLLLGYKEKNRDFLYTKKKNVYLKTNYSIMNMLKMFGFHSKLIPVKKQIEEYEKTYKSKNVALNYVVSDILRDRIKILKKIITDIQRYIRKVVYNFNIKEEKVMIGDEENPDKFLLKYKNKLENVVFEKDKTKFMRNWKIIKEISFESIHKTINIDPKSEFVLYENIEAYDPNGDVILYFIVNELGKLIDLNDEKFIKTSLIYLIFDIIIREHAEFDEETNLTNNEIKRFLYSLEIVDQKQIQNIIGELVEQAPVEDIEKELAGEIVNEQHENLLDAIEEEQAIDTEEGTLQYEIDYESGVNMNFQAARSEWTTGEAY
jgi:hypothetical protein